MDVTHWVFLSLCVYLETLSFLFSSYGATAPSGPCFPSEGTSILLCLPPDDVIPSCSWFYHCSFIMKFPSRTFFEILSASIFMTLHANHILLILILSPIFRSLYELYISLLYLGRQRPSSCFGRKILFSIFLPNVNSICSVWHPLH
jgi:hypothetical protein